MQVNKHATQIYPPLSEQFLARAMANAAAGKAYDHWVACARIAARIEHEDDADERRQADWKQRRRSDHLVYICEAEVRDYGSPRCQQVRGLAVDAEIERLVLQASEPDRVALALGALE